MTTPELLPCPFCGEQGEMDGTTWRPTDGKEVGWITCNGCNAYGPTLPKSEAIAAWNTRAPLSPDAIAALPAQGVQSEAIKDALASLDMARDALEAALAPAEAGGVDWRDDPSADERWNAGCDFAMTMLCQVVKADPAKVSWDAATETLDGDVMAVIGNILTEGLGEDWPDRAPAEAGGVEAQRCAECDCDDGNCTWIKSDAPEPRDVRAEALREAAAVADAVAESCAGNVFVYSPPMAGANEQLRMMHEAGEAVARQVSTAILALIDKEAAR